MIEHLKIYAKTIEDSALEQIHKLANCDAYKDRMIRVMPDVHAGTGCTIGTCISIFDKVVPNTVGVDIGCGMLVVYLGKIDIDFDKLDRTIHREIPYGCNVRKNMTYKGQEWFKKLRYTRQVDNEQTRTYLGNSVGSLGGGNHFIEVDKDEEDNKYLVIHSGSRSLGVLVCKFWQNVAVERRSKHDDKRNELIARLKAEHKEKLIQEELKKLPKTILDKDLAYLDAYHIGAYIQDMEMAQHFAFDNRYAMASIICREMDWTAYDMFDTIHNYIDTSKMIVRKGACSAERGERLIIPMNMRDGSLICRGKGNPDWLFSAPHGAGRLMSRKKAFDTLTLDEYKKSMSGIYSTSVEEDTIDESPMAYKPMQEIVDCIGDTVDIIKVIKPVYNFKAPSEKK